MCEYVGIGAYKAIFADVPNVSFYSSGDEVDWEGLAKRRGGVKVLIAPGQLPGAPRSRMIAKVAEAAGLAWAVWQGRSSLPPYTQWHQEHALWELPNG